MCKIIVFFLLFAMPVYGYSQINEIEYILELESDTINFIDDIKFIHHLTNTSNDTITVIDEFTLFKPILQVLNNEVWHDIKDTYKETPLDYYAYPPPPAKSWYSIPPDSNVVSRTYLYHNLRYIDDTLRMKFYPGNKYTIRAKYPIKYIMNGDTINTILFSTPQHLVLNEIPPEENLAYEWMKSYKIPFIYFLPDKDLRRHFRNLKISREYPLNYYMGMMRINVNNLEREFPKSHYLRLAELNYAKRILKYYFRINDYYKYKLKSILVKYNYSDEKTDRIASKDLFLNYLSKIEKCCIECNK